MRSDSLEIQFFSAFLKIKEINEISHLIEDHDEYPVIAATVKEVQEDVESTLKSNLEQWVEQSLALVSSGELT